MFYLLYLNALNLLFLIPKCFLSNPRVSYIHQEKTSFWFSWQSELNPGFNTDKNEVTVTTLWLTLVRRIGAQMISSELRLPQEEMTEEDRK